MRGLQNHATAHLSPPGAQAESLTKSSAEVEHSACEDFVYSVERGPLFDLLDRYSGMTSDSPRFIAIPTGKLVFNTRIYDTELRRTVSRHTDFPMALYKAIRMNRRQER